MICGNCEADIVDQDSSSGVKSKDTASNRGRKHSLDETKPP